MPAMEFAMNEAWILSGFESEVHKSPGIASPEKIKHFEEKYPNGQPRLQYSGWRADNGEFLLDGKENWYYENGQEQYEAVYQNGGKTATEKYRDSAGRLSWTKEYTPYNTIIYTTYWNNGQKRSQSTWSGVFAHGPTTTWDKNGNITADMTFYYGRRKD
jgi:antitoxin component YwqK of YwqJK toxin-antitoxin module